MIKIIDRNNKPIEQAVYQVYSKILDKIQRSGKLISDALKFTTQRHFQTIYPGSNHYSPKKVTNKGFSNGTITSGSINIDVAGITRAYKNLTIRPIKSRALTIPMHRSAYGKKASEFSDLFVVKKKNGKSFLAKSNGSGGITFMYFLANQVHQPRDSRLMPSDDIFRKNICSRITSYIQKVKI